MTWLICPECGEVNFTYRVAGELSVSRIEWDQLREREPTPVTAV
jgi:hypothetical protein